HPPQDTIHLGETRMTNQRSVRFTKLMLVALLVAAGARAKDDVPKGKKWVASWITAPSGTFAGVNAPRLVNLAFPFDPTHPPRANGDEGGGEEGVSSAVDGRNLAISIFIAGASGPMTFHGTALQESFLSPPGDPKTKNDHTMDTLDTAFPYETSSWFFVDGVD